MPYNLWEGQKVRLRAIEPEDWETHYQWSKDSELSRMLDSVWWPGSKQGAKKWTEEAATKKIEGDQVDLEIETLDGAHVGIIGAHTCIPRQGTFSYGIAVRAEQQRNGYASEAIWLLLRHFFLELRYHKCTVTVFSINEPSQKLHERFGFQLEGRLRDMGFTDGAHYDHLMYGMTAEEFMEKHLRTYAVERPDSGLKPTVYTENHDPTG